MRIGFGYDSHVFEHGKRLVLCGVEIPGEDGLKAHSDGDVALHALIDAIFGAAALDDIGAHFPDTDERWRGADSASLLTAAVQEVAKAGYSIGNVDITVICEKPKLRAHIEKMRSRVASLLGVDIGDVSIKGKTNEKMDDVGACRGIVCHAVCLLK